MNQKPEFLNFVLAKGIHLGYKKWKTTKLHTGKINDLSIFNFNLMLRSVLKVCHVFKVLGMHKKSIQLLVVNTNYEYNGLIEIFAKSINQNYVNEKWICGTITNWNKISQGIFKFQELLAKFPYIKPKNPKYIKMKKSFNGIKYNKQKPDLIFIIDVSSQKNILQEAHLLQIPVIAFVDSIIDQKLITYPIYCNYNSIEYIHFCLNLFSKIYNRID